MSKKYKVNFKGRLHRICAKGNQEYKKCINCEDLLTIEPRGGGVPPSKIWCRGAGVEGYNYKIHNKEEE